jgi:PAS domain S-box-containing protein
VKPDFIDSEVDEASMKNEIRILCVEDVPADVVMLNHALRLGGLRFRSKRVDTKAAFLHELEHHLPDVILSDHGLPSFDGFTALAIAKSRCPEVPFIFVTSALGEEMTISTFENGATDYVLKKDLSKLAPAVERALREARERAALKLKEDQLRESEQRYRRLIEFCPDAFFVECDGQIVFANMTAARLFGVENVEHVIGRPVREIFHPDSWANLDKRFTELREHGTTFFWRKIEKGNVQSLNQPAATFPFLEEKFVRQDGSLVEAEVAATPLTYQKRQAIQIIVRNITERKRAEEALQKSEERYRRLVERSPEAILVIQANDEIAFANPAAVKLLGLKDEAELTGKSAEIFFRPDPWDVIVSRVRRLRSGQLFTPFTEQQLLRMDGTSVDVELSSAPTVYLGKPAVQVIAHDISKQKRSVEELRQSEAMKALILETALDAIISVDHEGKIQEWNPAAEKIFGYKRSEAVGRPMDQLIIPPAMWEVYHDGLTHYLMTGVGSLIGRPIELTLKRKDGSEFRAEIGISRILTEDPPRCTALIRDITERKQAETFLRQSEERLRLLVENVKDYAIYMLDPEGKIVTWNTGAEGVEGYRAEEIIGKHLSTFFTPEDVRRNVPEESLKLAEREGRVENEGWRVRKDGSRFWSQGIITALRDEEGQLRGFSKIAHDITKQKKAEEKIRQLNEQLEQRVRARTAQLEAANNELEAFSYSVSHDLRAPLRHIAGYVEILQGEAADKLDQQAREHLQTVADSAQNLGELIDALLAFSRMGRTEMRQEHVGLTILVEEARRELRRDCEGRDIDWQIAKLPEVQGDPIMLRQVIINLISNALKYSRKRKQARIEIGATDSDDEVTFFVRDNGVGFDMKYANKLFGVFQRLHNGNEFEGVGIGLANVRRIIHRHGGRTWAEGQPDGGATFYFSVPKLKKEGI